MDTSGLEADGLLTRAKARVKAGRPPSTDAPASASVPRPRVAEIVHASGAFAAVRGDAVRPA